MIAGRYTLDREIGRGGMGAVWLGHDDVLGRRVALKRVGLLPGADGTDLERALREARLAARLDHPHVVSVFNLVLDADTDQRWLVMEYVDGITLAQLVREKGRLSPDEAAPLLRQAADALVAAHSAGIVHRDVKPSNILVDRNQRVKLTDFGIARIATDATLTQTGLLIGSPAYLAPEVVNGHRGDEPGDVWSLGATMFHVLAGRPPYEIGDNVLSGLYRLVNEEPPHLAEAGRLAPLLDATMVKDPARRWSMTQVRDYLARPSEPARARDTSSTRVLGPVNRPTTTRRQASPASRPRKRSRPRRRWGLLGVAAAILLVLALSALLRSNTPSAKPAAERPAPSPTATAASRSPAAGRSPAVARPTAAGMQSFIRGYVAAVASDPDTAWGMLSPRFQQESGGLDTYRRFWSGVGAGRVFDISADPRNLMVSYHVRFDNFGTGRRPTVLRLVYDRGRYLIDGEETQGFVPAG